jgi:hypothetical protein
MKIEIISYKVIFELTILTFSKTFHFFSNWKLTLEYYFETEYDVMIELMLI